MADKCFFCEQETKIETRNHNGRIELLYSCPHCGIYMLPNTHFLELQYGRNEKNIRFLISCYLFNENRNKASSLIRIDLKAIDWILHSIPRTVVEKVDSLLTYLGSKTTFFGEPLSLEKEIIYSEVKDELYNIVEELENQGLVNNVISTYSDLQCSLTMKGIEYLSNQSNKDNSDTCFIAMWFGDEMNGVFEQCITPACLRAGYKPVRVDLEQYNDDITDKIISLIKTTAFTIADFSGYRGGVYYEAGFARGLGKDVIYTCEKSWFNGDPSENKKIHFDVNHQNFIEWRKENLPEFGDKLYNRIIATIGKGSYKTPNAD